MGYWTISLLPVAAGNTTGGRQPPSGWQRTLHPCVFTLFVFPVISQPQRNRSRDHCQGYDICCRLYKKELARPGSRT